MTSTSIEIKNELFAVLRHIQTLKPKESVVEHVFRQARHGPTILSFINAHALNLCHKSGEFRRALLSSDILLRDGVGMEILLRMLGMSPGGNNNGTDLIPRLIASGGGARVVVFGSSEPWLTKAVRTIEGSGCSVVAAVDGFQPTSHYLDSVRYHRPDVVLLAMGMPKQELLALRLRSVVDWPSLIVSGGAILDFLSHRFRRAPEFLRKARLEWLFRLGLEPGRLWRRYVLGGAVFVLRAGRLWFTLFVRRRGPMEPRSEMWRPSKIKDFAENTPRFIPPNESASHFDRDFRNR